MIWSFMQARSPKLLLNSNHQSPEESAGAKAPALFCFTEHCSVVASP